MSKNVADEDPRRRAPRPSPRADLEEAEGLLQDLERVRRKPSTAQKRKHQQHLRRQVARWSTQRALDAFSELAGAMGTATGLHSLGRSILDTAIRSLGLERGILFLGRGDEGGLVAMVSTDIHGNELGEIERVSTTILRRGHRGEVIVSADAAADPRFRNAPSLRVKGMRTVLCAPLIVQAEPVGVLYLDAPAQSVRLPEDAAHFLIAFARLAAAAVDQARQANDVIRENARLRGRLQALEALGTLPVASETMHRVLQRARLVAQADLPVLIVGEPGTEKEALARVIHQAGPRALHPFVPLACSVPPPEMIEAMLFGRRRPQPHDDRPGGAPPPSIIGLLRQANHGILFLDELDALDLEIQAKLTEVLGYGRAVPEGGRKGYQIDTLFIATSSRRGTSDEPDSPLLNALIGKAGGCELHIPPLRERPEDVALWVDYLRRSQSLESPGQAPGRFTADAIALLSAEPWPGNVRQLAGVVARALLLPHRRIDAAALRTLIAGSAGPPEEPRRAAAPPTQPVRPFVELEREALRQALTRARGNKSKAARILGLHRNTLMRRLRKFGLSDDGQAPRTKDPGESMTRAHPARRGRAGRKPPRNR
ncbi:MAG: sigma-54-dependent Fis family transcriptional regulator [Candidatus Eisenbacteria sp.]|nr:sigma-54-dependent Fis family transcriptional regulator [Candidatus Eisenbacteria bacterium]